MRLRPSSTVFVAGVALFTAACVTPDPTKEVVLQEVEAYWVVDTPKGDTQRIAPAVRLKVASRGATKSIEAQASFRRKSEPNDEWDNSFARITQAGNPMAQGETRVVTLVAADAHYTGPVAPAQLLTNAHFVDVHVLVFIRVGPSSWVKMAELDAERRIGTHALEGR